MIDDFYFGQPKFNSVISLILCRLLYAIVIPDTPIKSSLAPCLRRYHVSLDNQRKHLHKIHWKKFFIHSKFHSASIIFWNFCDNKFYKNIYFCFIDYNKAFSIVDHNKLWKILQENTRPHYQSPEKPECGSELDIEQMTGLKLEKE